MNFNFFKYFLTVVISVFILLSSLAQNSKDSKGKQGPWKVYHKDGKTVKYIGQFKNDKPVGKFVFYYETGEPSTVIEHKDDGTSECKMYHLNGNLMAYGNYLNQQKEGVWWYYTLDKKVISQEIYNNGLLNGIAYEYFPSDPNGKLLILQEVYYEKGRAQGEWKKYYKDGKLQQKGYYKDGVQEGQCIWYDVNGKPELYGNFKNGMKYGRWKVINPDGTEEFVIFRNDEKLEGKEADKFFESLVNENKK